MADEEGGAKRGCATSCPQRTSGHVCWPPLDHRLGEGGRAHSEDTAGGLTDCFVLPEKN